MPHVLITNDDGIQAAGLRALVDAVRGIGRVSVVAPDQERSAASQSLTLRRPIFFEEAAEGEWAVEGTPTDAMIVALHQLFHDEPPDLVISGINRGDNLGDDIFYSGTVGAAMEATLNHVPAFAMSLVHGGGTFVYDDAAQFARQLAERVLGRRIAAGRAAERERAAAVGRRRALHAAVEENHAHGAAARHRSARADVLLAEPGAVARQHRSRERLCGDLRRAMFP